MSARIFPIGVQDFEKIRKDGYLYIDKTALVYQLAKTGSYYFLSRPRRFGKSLLISTLETYFRGKKELFKGLAIEKLEKDWEEYPVLHLDLNTGLYDSAERLLFVLEDALHRWENLYGTSVSEKTPELRFMGVIRRAYERTGRRVVILVDEYDKPLLQAIGNPELQEKYRSILKAFYGVLKTMDGSIKFALLTGVTKFGKVSVFSDLNNLDDLTMRAPYASLCGITEEELRTCFDEDIHTLSLALKQSYEETCATLALYYDGYHFTEDSVGVYNPFSLLNTFKYMRLGDYWFETGTPSYLVELLKRTHYDLYAMAHTETDADVLNSIDAASYNPIPVIYQSGYLTIKGYNMRRNTFLLDFPNNEVKNGFLAMVASDYLKPRSSVNNWVQDTVDALQDGDTEGFRRLLTSFLSSIPYTMRRKENEREKERYFHYTFYLLMRLVSVYTEKQQSEGRVDCVEEADNHVYIFEFKLDGTADEALRQIEEKGYALPYLEDRRHLHRVGVSFSSDTGTVDDWKVIE